MSNGLVARFSSPEALAEAIRSMRAAGYRRLDGLTPFPVQDVADALEIDTTPIAFIAGCGALVGAAIMIAVQWWAAGAGYPLDIGGRPLLPWPAFISTTFIVAILWGALATFVGLLWMLRLPRYHHSIFEVPGFEKLWDGRFYLGVQADDPRFEADATDALLRALGAEAVHIL